MTTKPDNNQDGNKLDRPDFEFEAETIACGVTWDSEWARARIEEAIAALAERCWIAGRESVDKNKIERPGSGVKSGGRLPEMEIMPTSDPLSSRPPDLARSLILAWQTDDPIYKNTPVGLMKKLVPMFDLLEKFENERMLWRVWYNTDRTATSELKKQLNKLWSAHKLAVLDAKAIIAEYNSLKSEI